MTTIIAARAAGVEKLCIAGVKPAWRKDSEYNPTPGESVDDDDRKRQCNHVDARRDWLAFIQPLKPPEGTLQCRAVQ